MLTLSIIKADTGGFVGHTAVHPAMIAEAAHALERASGRPARRRAGRNLW